MTVAELKAAIADSPDTDIVQIQTSAERSPENASEIDVARSGFVNVKS